MSLACGPLLALKQSMEAARMDLTGSSGFIPVGGSLSLCIGFTVVITSSENYVCEQMVSVCVPVFCLFFTSRFSIDC